MLNGFGIITVCSYFRIEKHCKKAAVSVFHIIHTQSLMSLMTLMSLIDLCHEVSLLVISSMVNCFG